MLGQGSWDVNSGAISPRDCAQLFSKCIDAPPGADINPAPRALAARACSFCSVLALFSLWAGFCLSSACGVCSLCPLSKVLRVGCGPDLHFAIVHGSSEMASPMMDIQHTKRLLGYAPQDGTAFASRPGGPKL